MKILFNKIEKKEINLDHLIDLTYNKATDILKEMGLPHNHGEIHMFNNGKHVGSDDPNSVIMINLDGTTMHDKILDIKYRKEYE